MSHIASVKCYVQDLDTLESVASKMGFELVRGATTYAWYGRFVGDYATGDAAVANGHAPETFGKCLHKLRRKDHRAGTSVGEGDYEIGLVARPDGKLGYELVYDNWSYNEHMGGARIEALAGKGLVGLKNALAEEVTMRQFRRMGLRNVQRTVDAAGQIKITASR